ncbi:hypothetical protein BGZ82_002448, partial [Podila clonocystis]
MSFVPNLNTGFSTTAFYVLRSSNESFDTLPSAIFLILVVAFLRFFFRHAPNHAYEAQLKEMDTLRRARKKVANPWREMRLAAEHARKLMKEREEREGPPYQLRPYVSKRMMADYQPQEFLQTASEPKEDHLNLLSPSKTSSLTSPLTRLSTSHSTNSLASSLTSPSSSSSTSSLTKSSVSSLTSPSTRLSTSHSTNSLASSLTSPSSSSSTSSLTKSSVSSLTSPSTRPSTSRSTNSSANSLTSLSTRPLTSRSTNSSESSSTSRSTNSSVSSLTSPSSSSLTSSSTSSSVSSWTTISNTFPSCTFSFVPNTPQSNAMISSFGGQINTPFTFASAHELPKESLTTPSAATSSLGLPPAQHNASTWSPSSANHEMEDVLDTRPSNVMASNFGGQIDTSFTFTSALELPKESLTAPSAATSSLVLPPTHHNASTWSPSSANHEMEDVLDTRPSNVMANNFGGQIDTPFTFTSTLELPKESLIAPSVTASSAPSVTASSAPSVTASFLVSPLAHHSALTLYPSSVNHEMEDAMTDNNPNGLTLTTKGSIINDSCFAPGTDILLPPISDDEWAAAWSSLSNNFIPTLTTVIAANSFDTSDLGQSDAYDKFDECDLYAGYSDGAKNEDDQQFTEEENDKDGYNLFEDFFENDGRVPLSDAERSILEHIA